MFKKVTLSLVAVSALAYASFKYGSLKQRKNLEGPNFTFGTDNNHGSSGSLNVESNASKLVELPKKPNNQITGIENEEVVLPEIPVLNENNGDILSLGGLVRDFKRVKVNIAYKPYPMKKLCAINDRYNLVLTTSTRQLAIYDKYDNFKNYVNVIFNEGVDYNTSGDDQIAMRLHLFDDLYMDFTVGDFKIHEKILKTQDGSNLTGVDKIRGFILCKHAYLDNNYQIMSNGYGNYPEDCGTYYKCEENGIVIIIPKILEDKLVYENSDFSPLAIMEGKDVLELQLTSRVMYEINSNTTCSILVEGVEVLDKTKSYIVNYPVVRKEENQSQTEINEEV